MPARTRTRNRDASFTVYYSKKAAQQQYFPHRRKIVRHKDEDPRPENRQTKLRPGYNVHLEMVQDSEEEEEEDADVEEGSIEFTPEPKLESEPPESGQRIAEKPTARREKRSSDVMHERPDEKDEAIPSKLKRRKRTPATRNARRRKASNSESDDEHVATLSSPEHDNKKTDKPRKQSTMTQLIDGRRPLPDAKSPKFKRARPSPRTGWGGRGKKGQRKDEKQRTLTQMIPSMFSSDGFCEDGSEDETQQHKHSQEWNDAITKRLTEQGLFQPANHDRREEENDVPPSGQEAHGEDAKLEHTAPSRAILSIEVGVDADSNNEEKYQPTKFIDAPTLKQQNLPRRSSEENSIGSTTTTSTSGTPRARKTKFALLSTPERHRIREIPSSQSPPESPLFTQISPQKTGRVPLEERPGNASILTDNPSKRKQVTFQEPLKARSPPRRTFGDVIQDSEDEEDDELIEDEVTYHEHDIGVETQTLIQCIGNSVVGRDVGSETQAMIKDIDHICACVDEDKAMRQVYHRKISEELGEPYYRLNSSRQYPSGAIHRKGTGKPEINPPAQHTPPYQAAHACIKREFSQLDMSRVPSTPTSPYQQPSCKDHSTLGAETSLPEGEQYPRSSPPINHISFNENILSTPMVIKDEHIASEEDVAPTPPHQLSLSLPQPASVLLDLDGEPLSSSHPPKFETQDSHSSKAEQQLQAEWHSYSQYRKGHIPFSSSMHVAHDTFSYQATPYPPRAAAPLQHSGHLSQATTVDPSQPSQNTTPRKLRSHSQPVLSANTTPRKTPSCSQPFDSAQRLPPLVIPSSFPSPKVGSELWSSPLVDGRESVCGYGVSQFRLGSVDDFSIPAPPPGDDIEYDEEL